MRAGQALEPLGQHRPMKEGVVLGRPRHPSGPRWIVEMGVGIDPAGRQPPWPHAARGGDPRGAGEGQRPHGGAQEFPSVRNCVHAMRGIDVPDGRCLNG